METDKTFTRSTSVGKAIAAAPRIEIYFKSWCPYNRWALALLSDKGVPFTTIDVTSDRVLEAEMIDRSGRTSVPQVFIDNDPIGGYDDLKAFVASGAFARRLGHAGDTLQAA
jgi:glutaredoxin